MNIYRTLLFMSDASLASWMNILERHQILSSLQFWREPHGRLEKFELAHLNSCNFDSFFLLLKKKKNAKCDDIIALFASILIIIYIIYVCVRFIKIWRIS